MILITDTTTPAPGSGSASAAPRTMPGFKGVPWRDYVTDLGAALLLLLALGLTWSLSGWSLNSGTDRIEVILTLVIAVVGLLLPYLWRIGVLPAQWNMRQIWALRALTAAPFIVLSIVQLVLGIISEIADTNLPFGAGAAMIAGLAGATLVATPRAAEVAAEPALGTWFAGLLRPILLGLAGLAAALYLLGVIVVFTNGIFGFPASSFPWAALVSLLFTGAAVTALSAWLSFAAAVNISGWRPILLVVAAVLVIWSVLFEREEIYPLFTTMQGVVVLAVAGALALAPLSWTQATDRESRATDTARATMEVIAFGGVFTAVLAALSFAINDRMWPTPSTGTLIATLIFSLLLASAAVVARMMLHPDNRMTAYGALGAALVFGIVLLVVAEEINWLSWLLAVVLPVFAAAALWAPTSKDSLSKAFAAAGGNAAPADKPAKPADGE